jgi:hypothetical protein
LWLLLQLLLLLLLRRRPHKLLLGLVLARRTQGRGVRQLLLLARRAEGTKGRHLFDLSLLMGYKLLVKHCSQVNIHLLCHRRCSRDRRSKKGGLRRDGRA